MVRSAQRQAVQPQNDTIENDLVADLSRKAARVGERNGPCASDSLAAGCFQDGEVVSVCWSEAETTVDRESSKAFNMSFGLKCRVQIKSDVAQFGVIVGSETDLMGMIG